MLHIADPKDIKDGKMTDVYFVRTMQILKAKKIDKRVKAEFIVERPEDYGWGVLAGIEETADLLRDLKVGVRAMKEGTIFRAYQPVIEIEGMYSDFGLYETSILGFQNRKILWGLPKPQAMREYVLEQLPHFDL